MQVEDGAGVVGDLLYPEAACVPEFWRLVDRYEPPDLYKTALVRTEDGAEALAYIGRRPDRSHHDQWGESWSGAQDPMFGGAFPTIGRQMALHLETRQPMPEDMPGFWETFVPLQGLYLVLVAILERYTALAYGPADPPGDRLRHLRDENGAAQAAIAAANPPELTVFDVRNLDKMSVPGPRSFDARYQVRNNLSHRGKAAIYDIRLVERSLVGLYDTLLELLAHEVPGLAERWSAQPTRPTPLRDLYEQQRGA